MADKSTAKELKISTQDGRLTIEGDVFGSAQNGNWRLESLADGTFVLQHDDAKKAMGSGAGAGGGSGAAKEASMARCGQEVFADFMFGLARRRWSGMVSADVGQGIKRIYFDQGEIVFAASNMMDDRLGEVIYRDGMITLDELTDSAVKVDRNSKFGQVLLANGTFTNVDLWQALKRQVQEIVFSVFIAPTIYFELQAGRNLAPTHVVFDMGTERLLDEAIGFGLMTRDFVSRLSETTKIVAEKIANPEDRAPEGTFAWDLLELLKSGAGSLTDVVNTSKLTRTNTLIALMGLVSQGLCSVNLKREDARANDPQLAPIKTKLDLYALVLKDVKAAFAADNKQFPLEEVQEFAWSLGNSWVSPLYLDHVGEIAVGSRLAMYAQCHNNPQRVKFFEIRLESLLQFLLQLSGDNLSGDRSKNIRKNFREMTL